MCVCVYIYVYSIDISYIKEKGPSSSVKVAAESFFFLTSGHVATFVLETEPAVYCIVGHSDFSGLTL